VTVADQTSDLAQAIQDVTTRAQLIVREEIELAKVEVQTKATKLAKGAAVGAAAGVFLLGGLIYFLHFAAWGLADLLGTNVWLGYLIVSVVLFLVAAVAGLLAYRFVKGGAPPTPQRAIEEAQRVRETISASRSDAGRSA
jgi:cobalamin biosynthesis protein CobD/CbiB